MGDNGKNALPLGNSLLIIFITFHIQPFMDILFGNRGHIEKFRRHYGKMTIYPFGNSDNFPGILFREGTLQIVKSYQTVLDTEMVKYQEQTSK